MVQEGVAHDDVVRDDVVQARVALSDVVQARVALSNIVQARVAQDDAVHVRVARGGVYQDGVYQDGTVLGQAVMEHVFDPDYGYNGPGDMRTHLWNDHGDDLKANGVSQDQLESMSLETVQSWHNFFHGTEGRPQH